MVDSSTCSHGIGEDNGEDDAIDTASEDNASDRSGAGGISADSSDDDWIERVSVVEISDSGGDSAKALVVSSRAAFSGSGGDGLFVSNICSAFQSWTSGATGIADSSSRAVTGGVIPT